jgi:hypothetical protein
MNSQDSWSAPARYAFRASFIALILFIPAFPLYDWPFTGWVRGPYDRFWEATVQFIGRALLHVPITAGSPTDSSDASSNWLMLACMLLFSIVGAAIWSFVDKRRAHPRLKEILDIVVRMTLGLTMCRYGIMKLYPVQFGHEIQYRDLLRPLGDFTPIALFWRVMAHSRLYVVFCGTIEVVAGLLLFWRRTAVLGALLSLAALTQVVVIDLSYDVTVKAYAMSLLLMAAYLLVPQAARLTRFFVLNAPVTPAIHTPLFSTARAHRFTTALKAVAIVLGLSSQVRQKAEGAEYGAISPLRGVYEVSRLERSAGFASAVFPAEERWTRIAIESSGFATVWTADGRQRDMLTITDPATHRMVLAAAPDSAQLHVVSGYFYASEVSDAVKEVPANSDHRVDVRYDVTNDGHLTFASRSSTDSVVLHLTRVPDSRIAMLGCPMHLINDRPYSGAVIVDRCPWYIR